MLSEIIIPNVVLLISQAQQFMAILIHCQLLKSWLPLHFLLMVFIKCLASISATNFISCTRLQPVVCGFFQHLAPVYANNYSGIWQRKQMNRKLQSYSVPVKKVVILFILMI